jgi:hypothetical protein
VICIILFCALVNGSQSQCDLSRAPEIVQVPRAISETWAECRDVARDLRQLTPDNLRIVRFEFYTPEKHTQEARK